MPPASTATRNEGALRFKVLVIEDDGENEEETDEGSESVAQKVVIIVPLLHPMLLRQNAGV